jgi:hypothetical protein
MKYYENMRREIAQVFAGAVVAFLGVRPKLVKPFYPVFITARTNTIKRVKFVWGVNRFVTYFRGTRGLRFVIVCDRRGGVQNSQFQRDVVYGRPPKQLDVLHNLLQQYKKHTDTI